MASKNLLRAYVIYKQLKDGSDKLPSQNDRVFLQKFLKKHREEFRAYLAQLEAKDKVSKTDYSLAKTEMRKSHEIRTSLPKPESREPLGSKETLKVGNLIKSNTKAIRTNAATWRGIDAAIKDGAIDGTKIKALEKQGEQKEAYNLGVKLVKEYLKDVNKILEDNEQLQVDGIYGRKSKAALTKYKEAKQAFAGDDQSNNPNLKNASTGDRYQRRRAYSYNLVDDGPKTHSDSLRVALNGYGYTSLDSIRNDPSFLAGLTVDSLARFNADNAYIYPQHGQDPNMLDSTVYTPRGQFINYTAGISVMPGDTIDSRYPMTIGEEVYEPYLSSPYIGRRGSMLYNPIWPDGRLRTDTMGIRGVRGPEELEDYYSLHPVDSVPGLYSDEVKPYNDDAYAYYNSSPLMTRDSTHIHPDTMLAHPELIEQARLASEAIAALDTIKPIYLNILRKGGLLKRRCKK